MTMRYAHLLDDALQRAAKVASDTGDEATKGGRPGRSRRPKIIHFCTRFPLANIFRLQYPVIRKGGEMSKKEKLLAPFMEEKKDLSFSDLVAVFESFGYSLQQGKGSHVVLFNESTGAYYQTWKTHGRKENTVPVSEIRKAKAHLKKWRLL